MRPHAVSRLVAALVTACGAIALLGASPPPQHTAARYFLGTWNCGGVKWTWSALDPGSGWVRIVYGDPKKPAGSAVVGYVDALRTYVYRDFHADGSYADLVTAGPVGGRWTFNGPYYPSAASAPLYGRIIYIVVNPRRYDRTFAMLKGRKLVPMGGDRCIKVSPKGRRVEK